MDILVTATAFFFGLYTYSQAYRSDNQKYQQLARSPFFRPSSLFKTRTYAVMFLFPPIFGAATLFLIYIRLKGEMDTISVFFLLTSIFLGPYLIKQAFNSHKKAQFKPTQESSITETPYAEYGLTRTALSPEKAALYKRMFLLQCLVLLIVSIFVISANIVHALKL